MNRFVIALLAGAGIAATAQAGMSYNLPSAAYGHSVTVRQGTTILRSLAEFPVDGDAMFVPMTSPTAVDLTSTINPGEFPTINSVQVHTTGTLQRSSSRLEVTWDHASHVSATLDTTRRVSSILTCVFGGQIAFDADATVRMYFNAQSPTFGALAGGTVDLTTNPNQNPNSPLSSFNYSSSSLTSVPVPFDIQFPVVAGNVLDFNLRASTSMSTNIRGGAFETGWDRLSSGSLIIEIIPAPSAAGLLALGGFAATRRRRLP